MKMRKSLGLLVAAVTAVSIGSMASASDLIWLPGGVDGSGNWNTSDSNWFDPMTSSNTTWTNGNNAVFGNTSSGATGATSQFVDLSEAITVQDLTLNTATDGSVYSLSDFGGGSLTVNGNIVKTAGGGNPVFLLNNGMTLGAGSHTITANDTGGDGAPEISFNTAIGGTGSVVIDNGPYITYGSTAFNVDNTYSGGTTINKGRLEINSSGSLGTGAVAVNNLGTLAIGGSNTNPSSSVTVTNAVTITRDTYSGGDYGIYGAAILTNNGSGTTTFSGPFTVDSNDVRIAANSSTLVISSNIAAGSHASTPTLSVTGDFAGFVHLTGNNTALTGGVKIINGVQLEVDNDNQIGGVSAPLQFIGGGTYHPINGYATDFGTHVINASTFNGGIYVDSGKVFNINQALGDSNNAVGSLGKRGDGTMNISAPVNLRGGQTFWDSGTVNVSSAVTLASLHLRSPVVNIGSGGSITTVAGYNSFGSDSTGTNGGPDIAVVNITGNGQFIQTSGDDFNVSDNANTQGTINVKDNAVLTTTGITFLGKSAGAVGTINQSGGTVTITRGGNFGLVLGDGRFQGNSPTGNYNMTGGTLVSAGETYLGEGSNNGSPGVGHWTQSGGDVTINNWLVFGREGGMGTMDMSGGTFTKNGGGNTPMGESNKANYLSLSGNAVMNFITGELWIGNGGGNQGTLNIKDSASLSVQSNWLAIGRAGATGVVNMSGGTLIKNGGGNFSVGSGGNGTVNMTAGVINVNGGETYFAEGGNGTLNMSGGTFTANVFDVGHTGGGTAIANISGTASLTANIFRIAEANSVSGEVDFSGGTITANQLLFRNSSGSKVFNWTGGTLKNVSLLNFNLTQTGPTSLLAVESQDMTIQGNYSVNAGKAAVSAGHGLTVTGTVSLANAAKVTLPSTTHNVSVFGGLTIGNDGAALGSRTYGATIDVGTSDIVVHGGSLADISDMARTGQNGVTLFAGAGITSSIAATDAAGQLRYAVGVVQNNIDGSTLYDTFDGVSVGLTDVLVKFTYFGDADLNGIVDDTDFFLINNGYANGLTGWVNGDFDYSGSVDDTDFFLINNAYALQGSGLRAGGAVPEPTGMGVLALAAGALLGRRRK